MIEDQGHWNRIIASLPNTHLLQTWQWGQVKSRYGWSPVFRIWGDETRPDAAALILIRTIKLGGFASRLRVIYVPKGPLLRDWHDAALRNLVFNDLADFARKQGAIFIKIDPDLPLGRGIPGSPQATECALGRSVSDDLHSHGWRYSDEQIQFRNTVLIDLTASEDEMLARMKQKTRYNIRLAGRKGVVVRIGDKDDLGLLYRMYADTAHRDGFAIRDEDYYRTVWSTFMRSGLAEPLIAEVEGQAVAAVVIFHFAGQAYYMYGMSRPVHRNKMPTYLLQWEAMCRSKAVGCTVYDLWGAPEIFDERDSMWGVFRFKRGLGGTVLQTMGAYDHPIRPVIYKLYNQTLPRILDVMRRRGKARIEDMAKY
jgi:lipid II:glycine glycyltransferase (peptidoglycan interpeptide bridge formation enzyme)